MIESKRMKKTILVATALLLCLSSKAQNAVGSWSLQPKAGINVATMTNDDDAKIRVGLVAGAELEYQASPLLSISAGALYSQQGAKAKVEGIDGTIKMDYVNVPILANFHVAKGLAFKLGIQPGFLVNDKVEVTANGVTAEVGLKTAFRESGLNADVNSYDFAIPLGVSYEFSHVMLDARYNFSVTDALSVMGETSRNSVFQLTIGYKFGL
jgi:opacity protein-like surface antigen